MNIGNKCKMICTINRRYIPLKLIYFFFMAGESCAMLYRSVFMKHLGMSTKQTGIIWTLERIVSVIVPPFLGALADKTRRPKLVLIVLLLGGSCTLFSMYFVPQEQYVQSGLNSPLTEEDLSQGNVSFCSQLVCDSSLEYPITRHEVCIINDSRRDEKHCHTNYTDVSTLACDELDYESLTPNTALPKYNDSGSTQVNVSLTSVSPQNLTFNTSDDLYQCSFASNDLNISSPVLILSSEQVDQLYFSLLHSNAYHATRESEQWLCVDNDVTVDTEKPATCDELMPNDVDEYGVTFWLLTILVFVSSFAAIGSYPIMETSVLAVLGPEKRHKFGQQRLWASVGFGSAALIIGYLKDRSSESIGVSGTNRAFLSMFVGVLICWCCAAVVASKLPIQAGKKSAKVRIKDIRQVLKRPKALAFFSVVLFYGADNAVQEIYLFWLAEVKLNAPSFILGASTFIGALLDIPFCLAAGSLVRKFGHAPLICFGLNTFGLRLILCALVTQPWQLIAVESLRCITWGLTWIVICSYTAKISPKGLETSTMGITQALLWGVGYSIGALLGGVLFQSIGGDNVFLSFGIATVCAATVFGIFTFCNRNRAGETKDDEDEEAAAFGVSEEDDKEKQ